MIKLLRIDDRLIHGQVAVYWINATGADTIVIANDKHATNAMLKMSLTVGKPAGVKTQPSCVPRWRKSRKSIWAASDLRKAARLFPIRYS